MLRVAFRPAQERSLLTCYCSQIVPFHAVVGRSLGGRSEDVWSYYREPGSIPGRVTPGFSHVGIVPDNAAGRRFFWGIRFVRSCIPTAPFSHHFNLLDSHLDVKSHSNLSTQLNSSDAMKELLRWWCTNVRDERKRWNERVRAKRKRETDGMRATREKKERVKVLQSRFSILNQKPLSQCLKTVHGEHCVGARRVFIRPGEWGLPRLTRWQHNDCSIRLNQLCREECFAAMSAGGLCVRVSADFSAGTLAASDWSFATGPCRARRRAQGGGGMVGRRAVPLVVLSARLARAVADLVALRDQRAKRKTGPCIFPTSVVFRPVRFPRPNRRERIQRNRGLGHAWGNRDHGEASSSTAWIGECERDGDIVFRGGEVLVVSQPSCSPGSANLDVKTSTWHGTLSDDVLLSNTVKGAAVILPWAWRRRLTGRSSADGTWTTPLDKDH
ncbi:hypothetical protein PR048_027870 [Dryococelus australis]|uniref:Uncharacterized protein n=1 Tax=Dryococelus australis TaxID=614101 RepID=A0ABQ9GHP9_9NEOP|nr:hypothetical protein PR048_027870 [Dryococelus australis]